MTVKGVAGQCLDNLLNFGSNSIAVNEVGVIKDGAEETFGQKVLNEHLIDNICADLGVK